MSRMKPGHCQDPCGCEYEVSETGLIPVEAACAEHGGQLKDNTCPCGCQAQSIPGWWRNYRDMRFAQQKQEAR